jgi:hypothetical protein
MGMYCRAMRATRGDAGVVRRRDAGGPPDIDAAAADDAGAAADTGAD